MATKAEGDLCYQKADKDEPLFVLRAQDATAPSVVEFWYAQNPQVHHTPKGTECLELIQRMKNWQNERLVKLAD